MGKKTEKKTETKAGENKHRIRTVNKKETQTLLLASSDL
jgi:hypothetical protein